MAVPVTLGLEVRTCCLTRPQVTIGGWLRPVEQGSFFFFSFSRCLSHGLTTVGYRSGPVMRLEHTVLPEPKSRFEGRLGRGWC